MHAFNDGAGGGGGGGAIQITAHGTIVINGAADRGCDPAVDPSCNPDQLFNCLADIQATSSRQVRGTIQANGGKGGDGGQNAGAGGGGSGGGILLQATGSIFVDCASLQANGGIHGLTSGQNRQDVKPGSGDGGPGWIRVEPRTGGGPYCGILALETTLSAPLDTSQLASRTINVADASKFPTRGVVLIDTELIGYNDVDRTQNLLKNLSRGLRGTTVASHAGPPTAARVILDTPVFPPESLIRGASDVNITPDPVLAGSGPDGVLHAFFIESTDPETGLPLVDAVTGQRVSLWTIDTDTSAVIDPTGSVVMVGTAARSNPGVFSFSRLRIDTSVILRAVGSRPLRIFVTEIAEIAGTLDASGFDGGPLDFDVNSKSTPDPGVGGRSGPGGGEGGQGGTIVFLDGNFNNKNPANVLPVAAKAGGLPSNFPLEFDRTGETSASVPPPSDLAELEATRATPGEPLRDPVACGLSCTAGGGGGGGNLAAGADGQSCPPNTIIGPVCAPKAATFGRGGSRVGLENFRYAGQLLLMGGDGGSGGGASADVSDDYKNGKAGNSVFRAAARYAPGTGGGGGGGIVQLVVQGGLILRSTGAILARGGNAYQSIDLGGNGGAGAGGSVLIQLANSVTIEPGARIDVSGGVPNKPPPIPAEQTLPIYESNIRLVGTEQRSFGGGGGRGAVGRVRLEAPANSNLLKSSLNENISSSVMYLDASLSTGCSVSLPLGVGPGGRALSHLLKPDSAALRFAEQGLPDGTDAFVLWQGAGPSFDVHGEHGTLRGAVEDLRDLQDVEYVQFSVYFISNVTTRETPTVIEVNVPVRLANPKIK
jgi:hypothetical protein